VLLNPVNATVAETTSRDVQEVARVIGLQIHVLNASTIREIDAAFAALARDRLDAVFVAGDSFFASRRAQFVTLAARDRIPAAYWDREIVAAGGLMSYGTNSQTRIVRSASMSATSSRALSADLPVVQSTKFEFVINWGTARALGIDVPPSLLAIADEAIE
jgi:putative ABC transport system substrate-binding protein